MLTLIYVRKAVFWVIRMASAEHVLQLLDYHADLLAKKIIHMEDNVDRLVPTTSTQLHCEQLLRAMKTLELS